MRELRHREDVYDVEEQFELRYLAGSRPRCGRVGRTRRASRSNLTSTSASTPLALSGISRARDHSLDLIDARAHVVEILVPIAVPSASADSFWATEMVRRTFLPRGVGRRSLARQCRGLGSYATSPSRSRRSTTRRRASRAIPRWRAI